MTIRNPWMRFGGAAGPVAGGLIAGGVLAGTLPANAADDTSTTGTERSTSRHAGEDFTVTGTDAGGHGPHDGDAEDSDGT